MARAISISKNQNELLRTAKREQRNTWVDSSKTQYFRREKFCIKHGWVDVLAIGGDAVWNRHHDSCLVTPSSGLRTRS